MSAEAPAIEELVEPQLPPEIRDNVVFMNGQANPELGKRVARLLGVELAPVTYRRFQDTSQYTRLDTSSRKKTIIAFQSHAATRGMPEADAFYQHLQMIEAATNADAAEIIAVAPKFTGDRQDKEVTPREAVSANLNQKLLRAAGADKLITVDMHNRVNNGVFKALGGTAEDYTASRMWAEVFSQMIGDNYDDFVMLPPDEGRHKEVLKIAKHLGIARGGLEMTKERAKEAETVVHTGEITGVEGKTALIKDDVLSTGGTLMSTAFRAKEAGAKAIYAAITHGQFSGDAAEQLKEAPIDGIFVTDTYPIRKKVTEILDGVLHVHSSDELLAHGLYGTITGRSNSEYFGELNY